MKTRNCYWQRRRTQGHWSHPTGRSTGFLLYRSLDAKGGADIWALPLNGGKPFPSSKRALKRRTANSLQTASGSRISRTKRANLEVYLQRFSPSRKSRSAISIDGGAQVRWRRDGSELFYIARDGRLIAVADSIRSRQSNLQDRHTSSVVRHECRWRGARLRTTAVRRRPRRSELPHEHSPGRRQAPRRSGSSSIVVNRNPRC